MNALQQSLAFQRDLFSLNKKNNLLEYKAVLLTAKTETERELGQKFFDRAVIRFFNKKFFYCELKDNRSLIIEVKNSLKRILPSQKTRKIQWYYNQTRLYPEIHEFVLHQLVNRLFQLSLISLIVYYLKNRQRVLLRSIIKETILFKIEQTKFYNNIFKLILPKNSTLGKELKGI